MTMITPSYLGETIEYSSLHACRSTLEDPTRKTPASSHPDSQPPRLHFTPNPRHRHFERSRPTFSSAFAPANASACGCEKSLFSCFYSSSFAQREISTRTFFAAGPLRLFPY